MARLLALLAFATVTAGPPGTKEWNDKIAWQTLPEGLRDARKNSKPVMTVIHMSWCAACKALKPQFAKSKDIEELSPHFQMVLAGDSDEPKDSKFRPEGLKGGYYPRIIFLKPDGTRIEGIKGPNDDYSAYFSKPAQIVTAMRSALKAVGIDPEEAKRSLASAEQAAKDLARAKFAETVPQILQEIFNIVDADKDQVLKHGEFTNFAQYTRGQVPTAEQYDKVCEMHGSPGGLTFDKMKNVYQNRPADELREVYKKIMSANGKHAEL
jgi:protein-disulfide reductase (glutathione)